MCNVTIAYYQQQYDDYLIIHQINILIRHVIDKASRYVYLANVGCGSALPYQEAFRQDRGWTGLNKHIEL